MRLLQKTDVIVYDHLVSRAVLDFVAAGAERIYAGKRRNEHTMRQEQINALLVKLAREGKQVVRLKGGDPFIFGRGGEELQALAAEGIAFEVVPGVTAASGRVGLCRHSIDAPRFRAKLPVRHRSPEGRNSRP